MLTIVSPFRDKPLSRQTHGRPQTQAQPRPTVHEQHIEKRKGPICLAKFLTEVACSILITVLLPLTKVLKYYHNESKKETMEAHSSRMPHDAGAPLGDEWPEWAPQPR